MMEWNIIKPPKMKGCSNRKILTNYTLLPLTYSNVYTRYYEIFQINT